MKLKLSDWASLAEIIGGFAIIVSVIYLAYEVRQNTSATRSLTAHQIFDSTLDVNQSIANNPELAGLFTRAGSDFSGMTETEQTQLFFIFVNYFNMWDSAHSDYKSDLLEPHAWNVWNNGMTMFMREYESSRVIWGRACSIYKEEFQDHVKDVLQSLNRPFNCKSYPTMHPEPDA